VAGINGRKITIEPLMTVAEVAAALGVGERTVWRMTERRGMESAHPRRALSMAEIARLLDAAERRPLLELQTIRIGPRRGKAVAKVKPDTKAIHVGNVMSYH